MMDVQFDKMTKHMPNKMTKHMNTEILSEPIRGAILAKSAISFPDFYKIQCNPNPCLAIREWVDSTPPFPNISGVSTISFSSR